MENSQMSRKTVALFMWASLVVGALSLAALSADQNPQATAPANAQPTLQGDLTSLAGAGSSESGAGTADPNFEVVDERVPLEVMEARNAEIRAQDDRKH